MGSLTPVNGRVKRGNPLRRKIVTVDVTLLTESTMYALFDKKRYGNKNKSNIQYYVCVFTIVYDFVFTIVTRLYIWFT